MKPTFRFLNMSKLVRWAAISTTILLSACGGGGGGSTSTPTNIVTANVSASTITPTVGTPFTLTWSSTNATTCTKSGDWSGTTATSGSQNVTPASAGTYTYTISCSGSTGNASSTITVTASGSVANNVVAMHVDAGPTSNSINQPYISVTICQPGTATCQTIDHVLVDTGSTGLRLIDSALNSSMKTLPAVTDGTNPVGECSQFLSGYMWGSVRTADITIGSKTALNMSIQHVGDTTSGYTKSSSCTGTNFGTVSSLGAKGILGVAQFIQDCGSACESGTSPGIYYSCNGSNCNAGTTMPLASQVSNPVASFTSDNNGVLLYLPAVSSTGAASLNGSLIFGIGTQSNNQLGAATIYASDSSAYFKTRYNGTDMALSFIDSGSNGLFFPDVGNRFTDCSPANGFYCNSLTGLTATNTAALGSPPASGMITFDIYDLSNDLSVTAAHIGGPGDTGSFDWGLPFFFGRKVFTAFEDPARTSSPYGYWAY